MILRRIKVIDLELTQLPGKIEGLEGYSSVQALLRLHNEPIGYVKAPLVEGQCKVADLIRAALEKHGDMIVRHLLCDGLTVIPKLNRFSIEELFNLPHPAKGVDPTMQVTVAVCTRDRTADLDLCLGALSHLDYPSLDVLVIDNAPSSDTTERLVHTKYSQMRYVCESRPGLNWARNRAILEARGEIIAYTDDDCVVDPEWLKNLAMVFAEASDVMAVTGLVVPYELETEAQILFEKRGGFGRGFMRKWYRTEVGNHKSIATHYGGSGIYGTGANMAFRHVLFDRIGHFDPTLDPGTPTGGGGDLEMFFRVLKEGYTLVYEPSAIVRHRHRSNDDELRKQLNTWGSGFCSYLLCSMQRYPDERFAIFRLGTWWFWHRNIRGGLLKAFLHPSRLVRNLIFTELWGSVMAPIRFLQSRATVARTIKAFGPLPLPEPDKSSLDRVQQQKGFAVRVIDLSQPLIALADVANYKRVRFLIIMKDHPLGIVEIPTCAQTISVTRLREAIVDQLELKLLAPDETLSPDFLRAKTFGSLVDHCFPLVEEAKTAIPVQLPLDLPVSVVVATYDRPADLRNCLSGLKAQHARQPIEIIVVDNHPASGMTPPVVAEYEGVVLVVEPRKGLSYARNAGILASTGAIVLTTDDDVTLPPDWVRKMIAPFARSDVMIVTGNVLPLEMETLAQHLFEAYGGLSRGFERIEANRDWFEANLRRAVPTWCLGSTANAAFRAAIFYHPEIGLFEEALGAGTPTGCSEDTYLFYKVLKAGYTILYEPSVYVWHKHRSDMGALRLQIYNYSKGHVAYHLITWIRDHDLRGLLRLFMELPKAHLWRMKERLLGRSSYPFSLTFCEVIGHLAGPVALWRSHRRVKRQGPSKACIPAMLRSSDVFISPVMKIGEAQEEADSFDGAKLAFEGADGKHRSGSILNNLRPSGR